MLNSNCAIVGTRITPSVQAADDVQQPIAACTGAQTQTRTCPIKATLTPLAYVYTQTSTHAPVNQFVISLGSLNGTYIRGATSFTALDVTPRHPMALQFLISTCFQATRISSSCQCHHIIVMSIPISLLMSQVGIAKMWYKYGTSLAP